MSSSTRKIFLQTLKESAGNACLIVSSSSSTNGDEPTTSSTASSTILGAIASTATELFEIREIISSTSQTRHSSFHLFVVPKNNTSFAEEANQEIQIVQHSASSSTNGFSDLAISDMQTDGVLNCLTPFVIPASSSKNYTGVFIYEATSAGQLILLAENSRACDFRTEKALQSVQIMESCTSQSKNGDENERNQEGLPSCTRPLVVEAQRTQRFGLFLTIGFLNWPPLFAIQVCPPTRSAIAMFQPPKVMAHHQNHNQNQTAWTKWLESLPRFAPIIVLDTPQLIRKSSNQHQHAQVSSSSSSSPRRTNNTRYADPNNSSTSLSPYHGDNNNNVSHHQSSSSSCSTTFITERTFSSELTIKEVNHILLTQPCSTIITTNNINNNQDFPSKLQKLVCGHSTMISGPVEHAEEVRRHENFRREQTEHQENLLMVKEMLMRKQKEKEDKERMVAAMTLETSYSLSDEQGKADDDDEKENEQQQLPFTLPSLPLRSAERRRESNNNNNRKISEEANENLFEDLLLFREKEEEHKHDELNDTPPPQPPSCPPPPEAVAAIVSPAPCVNNKTNNEQQQRHHEKPTEETSSSSYFNPTSIRWGSVGSSNNSSENNNIHQQQQQQQQNNLSPGFSPVSRYSSNSLSPEQIDANNNAFVSRQHHHHQQQPMMMPHTSSSKSTATSSPEPTHPLFASRHHHIHREEQETNKEDRYHRNEKQEQKTSSSSSTVVVRISTSEDTGSPRTEVLVADQEQDKQLQREKKYLSKQQYLQEARSEWSVVRDELEMIRKSEEKEEHQPSKNNSNNDSILNISADTAIPSEKQGQGSIPAPKAKKTTTISSSSSSSKKPTTSRRSASSTVSHQHHPQVRLTVKRIHIVEAESFVNHCLLSSSSSTTKIIPSTKQEFDELLSSNMMMTSSSTKTSPIVKIHSIPLPLRGFRTNDILISKSCVFDQNERSSAHHSILFTAKGTQVEDGGQFLANGDVCYCLNKMQQNAILPSLFPERFAAMKQEMQRKARSRSASFMQRQQQHQERRSASLLNRKKSSSDQEVPASASPTPQRIKKQQPLHQEPKKKTTQQVEETQNVSLSPSPQKETVASFPSPSPSSSASAFLSGICSPPVKMVSQHQKYPKQQNPSSSSHAREQISGFEPGSVSPARTVLTTSSSSSPRVRSGVHDHQNHQQSPLRASVLSMRQGNRNTNVLPPFVPGGGTQSSSSAASPVPLPRTTADVLDSIALSPPTPTPAKSGTATATQQRQETTNSSSFGRSLFGTSSNHDHNNNDQTPVYFNLKPVQKQQQQYHFVASSSSLASQNNSNNNNNSTAFWTGSCGGPFPATNTTNSLARTTATASSLSKSYSQERTEYEVASKRSQSSTSQWYPTFRASSTSTSPSPSSASTLPMMTTNGPRVETLSSLVPMLASNQSNMMKEMTTKREAVGGPVRVKATPSKSSAMKKPDAIEAQRERLMHFYD